MKKNEISTPFLVKIVVVFFFFGHKSCDDILFHDFVLTQVNVDMMLASLYCFCEPLGCKSHGLHQVVVVTVGGGCLEEFLLDFLELLFENGNDSLGSHSNYRSRMQILTEGLSVEYVLTFAILQVE